MAAPPIYPELQGLTFDFVRRPTWSTSNPQHISGRQTRIGYYGDLGPIYEWDLRYDMLRDYPVGLINSELKRLEGFFLQQQGRLTGFLFRDPDDYQVTGQELIAADDTGTRFRLVRTYGDADLDMGITEPIGWVNLSEPFNLYLNGIPQSPGSYSILQSENVPITWDGLSLSTLSPSFADWISTSLPYASVGNQIIEISVPAGTAVTVDMTYFFYVRFGDDSVDFENFARQLWELKKVTLRSLRREIAAPDFSGSSGAVVPPPAGATPIPGGQRYSPGVFSPGFLANTASVSFGAPYQISPGDAKEDIFVLMIESRSGDSGPAVPVSSITSSPSLAWQKRTSFAAATAPISAGENLEIWWADARSLTAGTLVDVTANFSGTAYLPQMFMRGIIGVGFPAVWDSNPNLPRLSTGALVPPSVSGISTTSANTILLAFMATPQRMAGIGGFGGMSPAPPWSAPESSIVNDGANVNEFATSYLAVAAIQNNILVAPFEPQVNAPTGSFVTVSYLMIVDAIVGT